MPERNSWGVSYAQISFLETALRGHARVSAFQRTRDICFDIQRVGDLPPVKAVLLDEYTLGLAAVLKALAEFGRVDCIVTAANWNGYTTDAKQYGAENSIGIFIIGEFLGSLFLKHPHQYVKKDENGQPKYYYKSS